MRHVLRILVCPGHILAPLPETVRGFGIHIDGHAGKKLMAYTNGSYVFIRSIEVRAGLLSRASAELHIPCYPDLFHVTCTHRDVPLAACAMDGLFDLL